MWIDIESAQTPANAEVVKVCQTFKLEWKFGQQIIHIHWHTGDKPVELRGKWLYTWNNSVARGLTHDKRKGEGNHFGRGS